MESRKGWALSIIALLVAGGIWFSVARVDRYQIIPDALVGRWVEVLDTDMVQMDVRNDRVTLISSKGRRYTCFVEESSVSNNLFGTGGQVMVRCRNMQASEALLWNCDTYDVADSSVRPWLLFKSGNINFSEVDLESRNFVYCYDRVSLGKWQRIEAGY